MNTTDTRMLKSNKPITIQTILIGLAILAGVCIRLIQLGQLPLDDREATLAMQAFQLAGGKQVELSGQPLYLVLTTALFYVFGSSNFLARLVPAVAGILLVLTPLFFRKYLRPLDVVLVTWLLALEPSIVAASRNSVSGILTLSLAVTANAAFIHQKKVTAGVLFGLLFLSGTGFWWLVLADLILLLLSKPILRTGGDWESIRIFFTQQAVWLSAVLTILLMGGLVFLVPSGFSAITKSIPDFISSIATPSGVSWWMPLAAVLVYSVLPLIFGFMGGLRTIATDNISRILLAFALVNLLLVILLPGREVLNLIWVTLPLVYLAGIELTRHFFPRPEETLPAIGISLLVIVILFFLWQIFGRLNAGFVDMNVFWLALGGGVVILILSAFLAVFGWSFRIAGYGYTWGFVVGLFLLMVMGSFNSIQAGNPTRMEIWNNGASQPDQTLLVRTIEEVSGWTHGTPNGLSVQVVGKVSPSLKWALRFHETIQEVTAVSPAEYPSLVITEIDIQPELASQYRGQDFNTQSRVKFEAFEATDWLRWFLLRKTDLLELSSKILWVRSDLFPGSSSAPIISE